MLTYDYITTIHFCEEAAEWSSLPCIETVAWSIQQTDTNQPIVAERCHENLSLSLCCWSSSKRFRWLVTHRGNGHNVNLWAPETTKAVSCFLCFPELSLTNVTNFLFVNTGTCANCWVFFGVFFRAHGVGALWDISSSSDWWHNRDFRVIIYLYNLHRCLHQFDNLLDTHMWKILLLPHTLHFQNGKMENKTG